MWEKCSLSLVICPFHPVLITSKSVIQYQKVEEKDWSKAKDCDQANCCTGFFRQFKSRHLPLQWPLKMQIKWRYISKASVWFAHSGLPQICGGPTWGTLQKRTSSADIKGSISFRWLWWPLKPGDKCNIFEKWHIKQCIIRFHQVFCYKYHFICVCQEKYKLNMCFKSI